MGKKELTYTVKTKSGTKIEKELFKTINEDDTYDKNGLVILTLKGVQKLANKEGIVEKKITTDITPTEGNKQQHVVNIWVGFKGDNDPDNWVRSSGEASVLNTGKIIKDGNNRRYEEFTCIDSQYRYAMAEKRAYCRAVLKLIQLPGVYASVEFNKMTMPDIENFDY